MFEFPRGSNGLAVLSTMVLTLVCGRAWADVVPTWATPNGITILVPPVGSAPFRATGNVAPVFDAMLIFDTSGSMGFLIDADQPTAPNGGRRRGDWAVAGAQVLIDELPDGVRLGLVDFDNSARLVTPIATLGPPEAEPSHRQALKAAVRGLNRQGGTNIAIGITFATQQMLSVDNPAGSMHLVLVTDGEATAGSVNAATASAIAQGIDSINTVGLPGADLAVLQGIANLGQGVFVDGTNLATLVEGFAAILDDAEKLARLDVFLPSGAVLENVHVDANGLFSVDGQVFEGHNIFRVQAISTLGNVAVAELTVIGVAVPEPSGAMLLVIASVLLEVDPKCWTGFGVE